MGAENSKPSSEVKQHVFSPYVHFPPANGTCAPQQDAITGRKLISLRAVNTPSNSPTNSSIRYKRTLSYVIYGPEQIQGRMALMQPADRLHAITTTRTPVPGASDCRAREAARTRGPKLHQVQRNPVWRVRRVQPTLPRREALRCHLLQSNPCREATTKGNEPEQRHRGGRAAEAEAGQQEEAGAGGCRSQQGQGGSRCVLEDTRPTATGLLEGD
jgi:hypothetical protein